MAAAPDDGELKDKLKLLRHSYQEVLDATKHQDDKVGRFLTAVSFLIGGSIALGTRTDLVGAYYQLEQQPAQPILLPAYLLSLFLLFIVISLVLLVTGLGARLHLPGEHAPAPQSHLFFLLISDMTESGMDRWHEMWSRDSRAVGEAIRDEYQDEIVNIARRAKQKYNRTLFAGAFLQLAILCLVLAAALGFLADGLPKVPGGESTRSPVDWSSLQPRLIVAIILTAFALSLATDFWWFERYEAPQRQMRRAFVLLCPAYAALAIMHPGTLHHVGGVLGFYDVAAALQVGIAILALVAAWTVWKRPWQRATTVVIAIALVLGPATFFAFDQLQMGLLLAASMIVTLLITLRLFKEPFPAPPTAEEKRPRPRVTKVNSPPANGNGGAAS